MSKQGVQFKMPPAQRPYGIEALLADDSRNWFSLGNACADVRAYQKGGTGGRAWRTTKIVVRAGLMARSRLFLVMASLALACQDCPDKVYPSHTYDETLDEWAGLPRADGTRPSCSSVETGRCADGKQFLARPGGETAEVRYFDDRRQFISGAEAGDVVLDGCASGSYGPSRAAVRCQVAEHEPLCSEEGAQNFVLPFAD